MRRRAISYRILALTAIFIITLIIIIGGSIRTFASSRNDRARLNRYYTSISVEKGDTLWSIADEYISDGVMDRDEFIEAVCSLNRISADDTLRSGEHLVVPYYSEEEK